MREACPLKNKNAFLNPNIRRVEAGVDVKFLGNQGGFSLEKTRKEGYMELEEGEIVKTQKSLEHQVLASTVRKREDRLIDLEGRELGLPIDSFKVYLVVIEKKLVGEGRKNISVD